jgi:hypothetical protein
MPAVEDFVRVVPNRGDAIRVVPVASVQDIGVVLDRETAALTPPPQLTYRGGPLLGAVEVVTVFWGKAWNLPANQATPAKLNAFFDAILVSGLVDQLGEYSTASTTIGHGRRSATATVTSPNVKLNVTDAAVQHFLQAQIGAGVLPASSANTLYFVYLPPGVSVTQGGGRSCQVFCGYHSDINAQVFYAVMPYPTCQGCTGALAAVDALTSTSSHELCEAITDPVPGQGWYDDNHGEIGDICAWKTKTVAGFTVQLEWSNKAGACV